MSFRLVSSGGNVTDPAMIEVYASGTIWPGGVVDFLPTSGKPVAAATSTSTQTTVFGVALSYAEGASDTLVKVVPFAPGQIWEADCVRAASTAHIGYKHKLRNSLLLENTAADVVGLNGVFEVIAIVGPTTGSGKVLGRFVSFPRSA